ncbi:hypothetical protein BDY19DRAFT_994277 [Irpex rosettiformis]|uniref:Uncharacterized protein n=1 Tax=Irpex rosettiformis TaxID=378272 RepID=A0ACB8U307_9APHY|nr:hypothetical protein BDY19DRAFT_994277 [Irpex rosettiformis]
MDLTYRYSSASYSPILPPSPRVQDSSPRTMYEHQEFFIEDEMVIFLVENCYFRVHKYFLRRDSVIFRDLFMCPSGPAEPEGRTKETAITLPGVTKYEMSCLLKFLYHGMYDSNATYSWRTSVSEWTALLSISTRYAFDRIRSRAIAALAPGPIPYSTQLLGPVDMIVLAVKHDIPQWLETAYVSLCLREHPLEEGEGEKLGVVTSIRLAKAREKFWREQAIVAQVDGRLEEDIRLGHGNSAQRRISVLLGQSPCPKRARATQIIHEVFWPKGNVPGSEGVPIQT